MINLVSSAPRLRVTEIFHSLQGETSTVGLPTVFVRLTGCPLRCGYCDTAYAFSGGEVIDVTTIVARVAAYGTRHVTVTGGEPLAQPACHALLRSLADSGFTVSLETSGALDIGGVDPRIVRIVDIKTPGSGEVERNRWENIALLARHDQIKFVICSAADYAWARDVMERHELVERVDEVLFSPSHGELSATALAEWILRDRLPVRLQIQLHKLLWGDEPGR
jgi:7-carboxy-7-deazaguanine synthase